MAGACRRERMPWKTGSVMEEKLRFVFEFELGEHTVTELCQRYEIARETGYVWLRRYRQFGVAGLVERSRAAHRRRNQTPAEMEQMVLELRQAHMRWGPRKLKRVLERDEPGRVWPATSTIGALLKREVWWWRARSACGRRRTRSRWRMPMEPTGCGARISRAGSAPPTESGLIR